MRTTTDLSKGRFHTNGILLHRVSTGLYANFTSITSRYTTARRTHRWAPTATVNLSGSGQRARAEVRGRAASGTTMVPDNPYPLAWKVLAHDFARSFAPLAGAQGRN